MNVVTHPDIITAARMPSYEAILKRDLAFHMGDREAYDFRSIADVCSSRPELDDSFVCLQPERSDFVCGDFYKRNCRIVGNAIVTRTPQTTSKQRRTIETVNRDLGEMRPDVPHVFAYRDGRKYHYRRIFGTNKPIPVFQYHRRRDLNAIIHPLRHNHEHPSRHIPVVGDTRTFRQKRPKIFWRGEFSGTLFTEWGAMSAAEVLASKDFDEQKREKYLNQSLRYSLCRQSVGSDILDAGLVLKRSNPQFGHSLPGLDALCRPRASVEEHLEYRYLLALDGYDGPSSHYWMLNSNSLVLRQESPWQMFGDVFFAPWVHYVPIAADGSDLLDIFQWCERNPHACETMTANARSAWSVLFNPSYERERRRALLKTYAEWVAPSRQ
jgi:hypothetical protein